ncbi:hypothetical protein [Morganella morganii]|uniref:hypothetical protein n=1 Tax=Morganella morganii TaxID=582 RepID=UPI001419A8A5|nr:hypothetical protein [Morganella morganii]NIH18957.1 hypothetical protein [Morganella morganii]
MTKLSVLTGVVLLAAGLFPAAVSASATPAAPVCKETVRDPESYDSTDECYLWSAMVFFWSLSHLVVH